MDEDDILIEVRLDDREITRQMDALGRKLQKSLDAALGRGGAGGASTTTRAIKDQETAAIRLAQAQARLATASGDLSKAQNILNAALVGVNKTTVQSISAQTQLAQVQNRVTRSVKELSDNLQSVGSRLTIGLTLPLGALAGAAIKTAVDFDSLKRGLISVSGSAAEAEKQLVRLKEVAKLPGLSFREAIQGSINLQAAGFNAERAEKALRVFGNALATVGKGSSELQGVILALSQIETKGKVSAEEINQLAERVPQIRRAIVAAFGTADTEIIQKAKITSRQFIDAVVTELDKLPKVTGGARNTFENLRDSIEQALLPLGNKLLSTILPAIEKLTPKILGLLEGFSKLSVEMQTLVIGFGAAAIAAGPLISALGNILFLLTQIRALGGVSAFIGAGVGVAGLAGAGLGLGLFEAERQSSRLRAQLNAQLEAQKLGGRKPFLDATKEAEFQAQQAAIQTALQTGVLSPEIQAALGTTATGKTATGKPAIDAKALAAANASERKRQLSEVEQARKDVSDLTSRVKALKNETGKLFLEEQELAKLEIQRAQLEKEQANLRFIAGRRALGLALPPQLPDISLPRGLAAVAPGLTGLGFPGQELASLQREAAEIPAKIPQIMSDAERFTRGFANAVETVGDAFERFGSNVAFAFTNVRTLFDSLKRAVFDFFNDLLGNALQNLVRNTLGGLFGGLFGGGRGGGLSGLFGSLGNLFRTPSFAGGDALSAPPSITQSVRGVAGSIPGLGGILSATGGGTAGGGGFSLGGLFGGVAGAAPLLGLGLGAGLGGTSTLGQIAGAIGGGAVGLGLSFGSAVFSAGGGLGQAALAALGPIAFIGAPLIAGAILLGRSAQRRRDEEASGQFLTQALQGIQQLAASVASGQIPGAQARGIFEANILGVFKQQISGLKTASVRKSRLTNQVRDLEQNYRDVVEPAIVARQALDLRLSENASRFSRQIPEFATGGTSLGGLALLHPGEKVLNQRQQALVIGQSNPSVFERAGVPGVQHSRVFDNGGTMPAGSLPIVIENLNVSLLVGKDDATRIVVTGGSTTAGRAVTVRNVNVAKTNREL